MTVHSTPWNSDNWHQHHNMVIQGRDGEASKATFLPFFISNVINAGGWIGWSNDVKVKDFRSRMYSLFYGKSWRENISSQNKWEHAFKWDIHFHICDDRI